MSVALKTSPRSAEQAPGLVRLHRFSVADYHQMRDLGMFDQAKRVELISGRIIEKMAQNPPHAVTVDLVHGALLKCLPRKWHVREQKPVTTLDSEPEPDLVVVPGPATRYLYQHPLPRDIVLLIEVADTSLEFDRTEKLEAYARARISNYWIVNLVEDQVEVHRQPKGGRKPHYRERKTYQRDQKVPLVIGGVEIARLSVADLLPPANGE